MSLMTGHRHTDDAGGSKRRLTYADFRRFPNDGQRHELINGKHAVTAAPNERHQRLSIRMILAIGTFVEAHVPAAAWFRPGSRTVVPLAIPAVELEPVRLQ